MTAVHEVAHAPAHSHPHERYTADELRVIARVASKDLAGARPQDVIRWAAEAFRGRVLISQSMANTALAHLVHTVAPEIPAVFLDTGYHFDETLATRDDLQRRTGLTILSLTPAQTVAEQDAEHGPELWRTNPDLCCRLRKVEPMEELLLGYDAWISGMRIASAPHREGTPVVEASSGSTAVSEAYFARMIGTRYSRLLQEQIDHGGIVLWVRTHDADHEQRALETLRRHAGDDVHLHVPQEPRIKSTVSLDYDRGPWSFTGAMNYVHSYYQNFLASSFYTPQDPAYQTGVYPSRVGYYKSFDLFGRYEINKNLKVSASIVNAGNAKPPYDPGFSGTFLYDFGTYDVRGRQFRVNVTWKM